MKTAGSLSKAVRPMGRRDFIRTAAALAAVGPSLGASRAGGTSPGRKSKEDESPLIGIQMGPHTMLDEGIEPVLDLIKETASIDTVMVYSHTYHSNLRKPLAWLAADHGTPPRDQTSRRLPSVWVRHHEKYFSGTRLRHQPVDSSFEYAGRDLLAEAGEPARRRGMKIYARILEGSGDFAAGRILGFPRVVTIDVYGRPTTTACWNHPEYRAFWTATVEDLFRSYDLDGLQWGAERMGPLMNVILPWNDRAPTCFCPYCRARGKEKGIDVDRAREGFRLLFEYVRGLKAGEPAPPDGVFTVFLRHLLRYPEILAWEYQYRLSREEVLQAMYGTIKDFRPDARVGWHVDHQPSSWDLVYRAELSYADMAPYSDFIKFIAYHDVLGPRIRWWYLERLKNTVMREIPLERSLDLYYDLFGYDREVEPRLEELDEKGFSPDYVFRETRRSVASAAGKTKIYPGIGFDVPWARDHIPADPDKITQAVLKAFQAGADGIVASREYEEMRLSSLEAVGRGVRTALRRRNGGSFD